MIITVPSYWRAWLVTTDKIFPSALIVVPKSQEVEYKKYHKNVLSIPDELDGNISRKRNCILNLFKWQNIVMLDDDILRFQKIRLIKKEDQHRQKELSLDEILSIFKKVIQKLELTNKYIWWFYPVQYPIAQRKLSEVTENWFIIWSCMIFSKNNNLMFDEDFAWKEDHDISIRWILKNKVLRYNHISFNKQKDQKTWWVSEQRKKGFIKDIRLSNLLVNKYKPYVRLNSKRKWEILYNF